jgi:hypothetical protein
MTPERYHQINELFDAALELPTSARPSFLAGACPDNPSLLEQVTQLLATHERAANFLVPTEATPRTSAPIISNGSSAKGAWAPSISPPSRNPSAGK